MRLAAGLLLVLAMLGCTQAAAWQLSDDQGAQFHGSAPVRRIVALSPALAELVYAAGAGSDLVGATADSDYPPAARRVPRVGNAQALNLEAILAAHPDVVLAWGGGTSEQAIRRLRHLGLRVVVMRTVRLRDVARHLRIIGRMAGTGQTADAAARRFVRGLRKLKARYAGVKPIRVFYQISLKPLFTVGGQQSISRAIALCGGRNVFAGQSVPAPRVSTEAVLAANPQVIVFGRGEGVAAVRSYWRRFPGLAAVRHRNVVALDTRVLARPTPRMLGAVRKLCRVLVGARQRLSAAK